MYRTTFENVATLGGVSRRNIWIPRGAQTASIGYITAMSVKVRTGYDILTARPHGSVSAWRHDSSVKMQLLKVEYVGFCATVKSGPGEAEHKNCKILPRKMTTPGELYGINRCPGQYCCT